MKVFWWGVLVWGVVVRVLGATLAGSEAVAPAITGSPYGFIFDDRSTKAGQANHARLQEVLRSLMQEVRQDRTATDTLAVNLFEGAGASHVLYVEPPSSAAAHRLYLPDGVTLAGRSRADTLRFGPERYLTATTPDASGWVWLEVTSQSRRPLRPFMRLHVAWPDAWASEDRLRALPLVQDGDTEHNARVLCGHRCGSQGIKITWRHFWPDADFPQHAKMRRHPDLIFEDVSTSGMVGKVFAFGGNGRLVIKNSDLRSGGMVFSLSGNGRSVLVCRRSTVALWRSPALSERAQMSLARHTMYGSRHFSTDADDCRFEGWPDGTIRQRWAFRAVGSEAVDSLGNRHVFRNSVLKGQLFLSRVSPTYFYGTAVEGAVALSGDLFMEGGSLQGMIHTDVWRARKNDRMLLLRDVTQTGPVFLSVTNGTDALIENGVWDTLSVSVQPKKGDVPSLTIRNAGHWVLAPNSYYKEGLVIDRDGGARVKACGTTFEVYDRRAERAEKQEAWIEQARSCQ